MNSEEVKKAVESGYVQIGSRIYNLTASVDNRCNDCHFVNSGCPTKAIDVCTVGHVTLHLVKKHNG